ERVPGDVERGGPLAGLRLFIQHRGGGRPQLGLRVPTAVDARSVVAGGGAALAHGRRVVGLLGRVAVAALVHVLEREAAAARTDGEAALRTGFEPVEREGRVLRRLWGRPGRQRLGRHRPCSPAPRGGRVRSALSLDYSTDSAAGCAPIRERRNGFVGTGATRSPWATQAQALCARPPAGARATLASVAPTLRTARQVETEREAMTADAAARTGQNTGPDGVDLAALAAYLPRFIPGAEAPLSAELIGGGRSNLTYYIRSPHGEWVLRRPPLGHVLPTAHDMAREFRVISALGPTDVPVPAALHLCEDPAIIGAPFYVMERVHGVIVHEALPPGVAPSPADRRRMSEAFIDALVRLHAVDYRAVELESFGRPQGFMERQVRRWGEQWERSKTRELPDLEELRRRLALGVPESPAPTIVHGDYRLENMILAADRPDRIVAILDWE